MIQETIVTSQDQHGLVHIAPMGIHRLADHHLIMPFKPSATLENIITTQTAVINYTDDVRIFAGCLTDRRDWPLLPAKQVIGHYLANALAHTEVTLERIEHEEQRAKLFCKTTTTVNHKPFEGFNRAQFAVLELAILVSRLDRLPWSKIQSELDYLSIGFDKTAGPREQEAWIWLMDAIEKFQLQLNKNNG